MKAFPANEIVVLQRYLAEEGEVGMFYARDPESGQGRIMGLALRYFPRVTGDGKSAIAELIAADPRATRLVKSSKHEPCYDGSHVPASDDVVRLTIGSTRVGGLYRDAQACITAPLTRAIDAIARDMTAFHIGRFDVRFNSLQELTVGRGFTTWKLLRSIPPKVHTCIRCVPTPSLDDSFNTGTASVPQHLRRRWSRAIYDVAGHGCWGHPRWTRPSTPPICRCCCVSATWLHATGNTFCAIEQTAASNAAMGYSQA